MDVKEETEAVIIARRMIGEGDVRIDRIINLNKDADDIFMHCVD